MDEPAPVDAIDLTPADREPVDAPANLNGVLNPELLAPSLGGASSPTDAVADETAMPQAGDAQMDVFSPERGVGEHFAVLSSDVFNVQDADGRWVDAELVADDYGWSLRAPTFTVRFPDTLSTLAPIVYEVAGGSLSIAPVGAPWRGRARRTRART